MKKEETKKNQEKSTSLDDWSDLKMIIEPEKELVLSKFQMHKDGVRFAEDIAPVIKSQIVDNSKNYKNNKKNTNTNLNTNPISIIPEMKTIKHKFDNDNYLFLWNLQTMLTTKELDILADKTKTDNLPEMFFGYNRFFIIFPKEKNLILEVNPIHILEYTNYEIIKQSFVDVKNPDLKDNKYNVNPSYYFPEDCKCQFYNKWKQTKVPEQTDIQSKTAISDWAFSSPYMGHFQEFNSHKLLQEHLKGSYEYLNIYFDKENKDENFNKTKIIREFTNDKIPVERLTPENPVLKYWEIPLFDDELNDNGLSMGNFRIRIMKDCFFGLLRSYLRVDNVLVRIVDTRIFHDFKTNHILRDFQVKENTYPELKSKGFILDSQWSLNHAQSDMVYSSLDERLHVTDKLTILYE